MYVCMYASVCVCVYACICVYVLFYEYDCVETDFVDLMMMKWCLMFSDVGWHIRDKLRPVPKHGSV